MSIQKAIDHWLETGDNKLLLDQRSELHGLWSDFSADEDDYRSGEETYGYKDVKSTMEYIADRWKCAFRISWIIDG